MTKEELLKRIANDFTSHVVDEGQSKRMECIRLETNLLAQYLVEKCPPSRELSLALTKLEEVMFWANSSIARENERISQSI